MQITPSNVYKKTVRLLFTRLMLGLVLLGSCGILLGAFMLIGLLARDIKFLMFLCWIPVAAITFSLINRQMGYRITAGYSAVVKNILVTGKSPDHASDGAMRVVASRFENPAAYRRYQKQLNASLRQLIRLMPFKRRRADGKYISEYTELFDRLSVMWMHCHLKYCVLGYTFYRYDQNTAQSAADGVAIYYCNYKRINRRARGIVIANLIFLAVGTVIFSFPFCALFSVFDWIASLAVLLALGFTWALKFAFLDSYLYCSLMHLYMDAVNSTPIPQNMRPWLCSKSKAFRILYRRGQRLAADGNYMDELYGSTDDMPAAESEPLPGVDEMPPPPRYIPDPASDRYASMSTTAQLTKVEKSGSNPYAQYEIPQEKGRPVYCMKCGSKNFYGARSCSNCGRPLN